MSRGIGFYGNDFFVIKSDAALVSESITRIIMTNNGERVANPYFGVNLKNFLFEPNDDTSKQQVAAILRNQLIQNEPRASIVSLDIVQEDNSMNIIIKFSLIQDINKSIEEVKIKFVNEE